MARKILLADDSVTAQNMGRKILADAGYEVITVNNGSAALKKIGEQRPDVIVLDVYMPGYSGLEVCQRVKEVSDTSRIPILLTVGKLEPFKPEEAKRVRADGFIVKPFEASELLSALSKLEDKIVPRSESSKPGRFGRIAAAEDSRFDKTMAVEEDTGWKNRIAFPSKKKEKEKEPEPEEAAVSAAPKDVRGKSESRKAEETVDVGALAGGGLPKDVTPEEIAALAAAAARIKGKIAEHKPEESLSEMAVVAEANIAKHDSSAPVVAADSAEGPQLVSEAKETEAKIADEPEPASTPTADAQVTAEEQSVRTAIGPASPEAAESAVEPVTMAVAAAAGGSTSHSTRWTAVSVALAPEDAGISLQEEMQKAYAEFAAAETGHSASITADSVLPEPLPSSTTVPATVAPEVAQDFSAVAAVAAEAVTAAVKELEQVASAYAAEAPAHVKSPASDTATALPIEAEKPQVSDVADAAAVAGSESSQPAHLEPVKPELAQEAALSHEPAPQAASEMILENMAAGADVQSVSEQVAQGSPSGSETPADTAAMAAAVGGKPVEETSSDTDPAIASIVDSVLANLRPKIVEEISRKLGKK